MPLGGLQTFPTTEPTSALTFSDFLIEVAYKTGTAYYGSTGTGVAQVPIDPHDLDLCQRIVNKGIRMFINDGPPPNGWSWIRPIAEMDVWPTISADQFGSTSFVTSTAFNSTTNLTTLTLHYGANISSTNTSTAGFYPSMELKPIYLGGNPPPGTPGFDPPVGPVYPIGSMSTMGPFGTPYTIVNYLSPTTINIFGQPASSTFSSTSTGSTSWSMIADGDYTLPADFSGQYAGEISYVANTNRGMQLTWTSDASIRARRQNFNFESGTPYECAVRLMPTPSITTTLPGGYSLTYAPQRRRWQLMTWRISSEFLHMIFPYVLGFDKLINLTDTPPCPFSHDETLKAAIMAVAEKEVNDAYGPDWGYYRENCLRNSYRIDAMNAPKKMGYFGNPTAHMKAGSAIRDFRNNWYQRPTVGVNPTG